MLDKRFVTLSTVFVPSKNRFELIKKIKLNNKSLFVICYSCRSVFFQRNVMFQMIWCSMRHQNKIGQWNWSSGVKISHVFYEIYNYMYIVYNNKF